MTTLLTAKFVMPIPGRLLERHFVVVENDRIIAVEKFRHVDTTQDATVIDLGDAVLMPGLVNAHVHLDYGHLKQQIDPDQRRFVPWLQQVLSARTTVTPAEIEAGIWRGLKLAAAGGTTTLGDLSYSDLSAEAIRKAGLRGVVYAEVMGLERANAEADLARVTQRVGRAWQRDLAWRPTGDLQGPPIVFGLAPLAPYAVSAELYRLTLTLMARRGDRGVTHLAETEAERELIQVYSGDWVPWIDRMTSSLGPSAPPVDPATSPVTYLARLAQSAGLTHRLPTVVHANYLDREDLELLADLNAHVVYCPRHHLYFDHGLYPLDDLLRHSVNVALGTESLLTADSTSILDEIRFLANGPLGAIGPVEILKMATVNGARALELENEIGVLAPGMQADLIAIPLSAYTRAADVCAELVYGESPVNLTVVAGRIAYQWLTGW